MNILWLIKSFFYKLYIGLVLLVSVVGRYLVDFPLHAHLNDCIIRPLLFELNGSALHILCLNVGGASIFLKLNYIPDTE